MTTTGHWTSGRKNLHKPLHERDRKIGPPRFLLLSTMVSPQDDSWPVIETAPLERTLAVGGVLHLPCRGVFSLVFFLSVSLFFSLFFCLHRGFFSLLESSKKCNFHKMSPKSNKFWGIVFSPISVSRLFFSNVFFLLFFWCLVCSRFCT